jgi:site-specific recombinase XerD
MPKTATKTTALARRKPDRAAPCPPRGELAPKPGALSDAAAAYAGASRAENTKRAYTNDFVAFSAWCREQGLTSMPTLPRTVALYLTSLAVAEKKVATIERALVAISQAHKLHGFPSPRLAAEVTEVLQGIRRTLGVAPNQKDPVLVDTLRALVEPMRKDDPGDTRDRALICLGFASGCRRSELVALDVADLSFADDGLEITIRRSKTDQEGLGRKVGIPFGGRPRTCPVRAVRDWIDFSLITEGPLFRPVNRFGKILPSRLTDQSVALIVKRWALEAGFDPALFAGHSLRSGLATAAAKAGKSERSIMKQTGHRSVSVVRRYIRDAELFDDNAAAGIGL